MRFPVNENASPTVAGAYGCIFCGKQWSDPVAAAECVCVTDREYKLKQMMLGLSNEVERLRGVLQEIADNKYSTYGDPWDNVVDNCNFHHGEKCGREAAAAIAKRGARV